MKLKLEDVELSVRTYNCLKRAGINTFDDLCDKTIDDMMRVRNLGRMSLQEILGVMKDKGLEFKTEDELESHTYRGLITADISNSIMEFESKVEGMALSKWGYNKEDVEKCLLELDRYRAAGLTPEQISLREDDIKLVQRENKEYREEIFKLRKELDDYRQAKEQGLLIKLSDECAPEEAKEIFHTLMQRCYGVPIPRETTDYVVDDLMR